MRIIVYIILSLQHVKPYEKNACLHNVLEILCWHL
jgi:hypothetical protein